LKKHPETRSYRRKRPAGNLGNFRPPPLTDHERVEVDEEVQKRAYLHGLEL